MPVSQFGAPRGLRGWLVAHLVARLTGDANRWMLDCLEVGDDDRILDVGCGPGVALVEAAARTRRAVVGVDPSPAMIRQARRRNRSAIAAGRVAVSRADAVHLPFRDRSFTKAGSLNSMQFWPRRDEGLRELFRVLEPGGRAAVVLMARSDERPGPAPPPWVEEVTDDMRAAGFAGVAVASRAFGGVLHRALVGRRPPEQRGALLDPTADGVSKGAAP